MRILIVGAGVAGLTLAVRLAGQAPDITIVERACEPSDGYAIGLYPLGSCVLHGIGLYDEFVARGLALERYELADHGGRLLQRVEMSRLTGAVGPWVMISRQALVDLLEERCGAADIRRGVTVASIAQTGSGIDVTFADGSTGYFDLVVACDGMNSPTRQLTFGTQPTFDAGWVLQTWWTGRERFPEPVAKEWWGHNWFFGVYPAPGAVMCAAGAPSETMAAAAGGPRDRLRQVLDPLPRGSAIAGALDDADVSYRWPMRDVRSRRWVDRRIALCGDAAAAFLPTAGVGASNAMRAAAALADELSRADGTTVPLALELYEKRCRGIIERNQTESRRLARVMFLHRPALGWARDQLARRYPAERMLDGIIRSMHESF